MIVAGALTTVAGVVWFRFLATLPDPTDIDNGDELLSPHAGSAPGAALPER